MKRISRHYLHKCLRKISTYCYQDDIVWADDAFHEFCDDQKNLMALKMLEELGNVQIFEADNRPFGVAVKSHSYIYLLNRKERWLERLYGFVAGVATMVIAEAIIRLIIA